MVEGVRWKTDIPMLRSFKNSILVYVNADQKIRYERMKKRTGKEDEAKKTFEQFLKEEKAGTEIEIPQIARAADVKIENNGMLDEFREKVESFYLKLKS